MPSFKICTLGCKVNQYESQLIREEFCRAGFKENSSSSKSDIYLINTCTVTSRSDSKSLDLIRQAIQENPKSRVLVTGCFAKANPATIKKTFKRNIIIGNHFENRIPQLLGIKFFPRLSGSNNGISDFYGHSRAFIKVQDGCNNHCAYCKIPLVRGNSKSRNLNEIKQEFKRLIEAGFQEIVLSGICLGAYGQDLKPKLKLSDLILELIEIKQNFRFRLSSIEAKDVSQEIINIIASSGKVCRHLHIPFQSGDNAILERMARKYSVEEYLNIVDKIRNKLPLIAITTDIMVGFPGETEKSFQNTLKFLKKVAPSRIHCFPFSPRPGTAAFNLADRVSDIVIHKRMSVLLNLAKQMAHNYQSKFVGKELAVLIEKKPDRKTGFFKGYSDNYIYTLVEAKGLTPGKIIKVKASSLNSHYLLAKVSGLGKGG